jgi:hypothetical protein
MMQQGGRGGQSLLLLSSLLQSSMASSTTLSALTSSPTSRWCCGPCPVVAHIALALSPLLCWHLCCPRHSLPRHPCCRPCCTANVVPVVAHVALALLSESSSTSRWRCRLSYCPRCTAGIIALIAVASLPLSRRRCRCPPAALAALMHRCRCLRRDGAIVPNCAHVVVNRQTPLSRWRCPLRWHCRHRPTSRWHRHHPLVAHVAAILAISTYIKPNI